MKCRVARGRRMAKITHSWSMIAKKARRSWKDWAQSRTKKVRTDFRCFASNGERAKSAPGNFFPALLVSTKAQKNELAQNIRASSIQFSIRVVGLLNREGARGTDRVEYPAIPIIQVEVRVGASGLPPYRGCRVLLRRAVGR